MRQVNGEDLLARIEVNLPKQTIVWENPYVEWGVGERAVALVDELMSLANAVLEGKEPTYGAAQARLDLEMNLAMVESGLRDRQVLTFPLPSPTEIETQTHQRFEEEFGVHYEDIEGQLDIFFPRR
jgi:hypothetical protein